MHIHVKWHVTGVKVNSNLQEVQIKALMQANGIQKADMTIAEDMTVYYNIQIEIHKFD